MGVELAVLVVRGVVEASLQMLASCSMVVVDRQIARTTTTTKVY